MTRVRKEGWKGLHEKQVSGGDGFGRYPRPHFSWFSVVYLGPFLFFIF